MCVWGGGGGGGKNGSALSPPPPPPQHVKMVLGHFGHGHFGLGRFGPDISTTDISATENAEGGRFGHNHMWVWNVRMHKCVMHFLIF